MISAEKNIPGKFSAVILAAGKSERFGTPKAFLQFNASQSFLQKLITEYQTAGINQVVVVTNEELEQRIKNEIEDCHFILKPTVVVNHEAEKGRFTSVQKGLQSVSSSAGAFIQNVDNPFTTAALLKKMIQYVEAGMYATPVYRGKRGHPLLLAGEIIHHILGMPHEDTNLHNVIAAFSSVEVLTDDVRVLANINTPFDYSKYFITDVAEATHFIQQNMSLRNAQITSY